MKSKGVPSEMAGFVAYLEAQLGVTGAEERLNTAVKEVTGQEPSSFRAFAEATKNVWT